MFVTHGDDAVFRDNLRLIFRCAESLAARSKAGTVVTKYMPHIYSDDRLSKQLVNLLHVQNQRDRVCVWRLDGKRKIKPVLSMAVLDDKQTVKSA